MASLKAMLATGVRKLVKLLSNKFTKLSEDDTTATDDVPDVPINLKKQPSEHNQNTNKLFQFARMIRTIVAGERRYINLVNTRDPKRTILASSVLFNQPTCEMQALLPPYVRTGDNQFQVAVEFPLGTHAAMLANKQTLFVDINNREWDYTVWDTVHNADRYVTGRTNTTELWMLSTDIDNIRIDVEWKKPTKNKIEVTTEFKSFITLESILQ